MNQTEQFVNYMIANGQFMNNSLTHELVYELLFKGNEQIANIDCA